MPLYRLQDPVFLGWLIAFAVWILYFVGWTRRRRPRAPLDTDFLQSIESKLDHALADLKALRKEQPPEG